MPQVLRFALFYNEDVLNHCATATLYKYLPTVIDISSKYGWIVPLKSKTGKAVAMSFQKLFSSTKSLVDGQGYGILQPAGKECTVS